MLSSPFFDYSLLFKFC